MERKGDEVHVDETEASGGAPPQGVRYVLLIGLFLTIVILSIIWITGAFSTPDNTSGYDDTREAVQEIERREIEEGS